MSVPQPRGKKPRRNQPDTRPHWQYHSRSDLNSSHLTVHGASRQALAVALVMVNESPTFISPDLNDSAPGPGVMSVVSHHRQPQDTLGIIEKVREIPRRTGATTEGYDGLGLLV